MQSLRIKWLWKHWMMGISAGIGNALYLGRCSASQEAIGRGFVLRSAIEKLVNDDDDDDNHNDDGMSSK